MYTYLNHIATVSRQFNPLVLSVPLISIVAITIDSWTGVEWFEEKGLQEILAPSILAVAVVVALMFWARAGDFYSRWLVFLCIALFCRELHFWGTNNGIYLALALLVWFALRNMESMGPFVNSRVAVSLFAGAMVTYGVTKTLDRGYWRFISGWPNWQDSMEESLESTGHFMVLVLVAHSYVSWDRRRKRGLVHQTSLPRRMGVWSLTAGILVAGRFSMPYWFDESEVPARQARGFPLELSAVCEVDQDFGERLFLASSDEDHHLTLWRLDEKPTPLRRLDLSVTLPDGNSVHLDDLEEITSDRHGTYYAVSSHRHLLPQEDASRQKKSHGTECALVRFRLTQSERGIIISDAQLVTNQLLSKIRDLGAFTSIDWRTSKVFSWWAMARSWQLNIEGLACVDGKILLGFKDPIENGRATILSYDPESDNLAPAARPDLGGHGILGMYYDASGDRLLVLSNHPAKHRFGDSCLWVGTRGEGSEQWVFAPNHRQVIEPASAKTHRKASGLLLYNGQLVVSFDSETESPIKVMAAEKLGLVR